jgi:hypothetical protein
MPASADISNRNSRQSRVIGSVKPLTWIHQVEKVMRNPSLLVGARLRCSDIKAPVYLHRVRGNDLTTYRLRQRKGQTRLPDRGRPDNDDQRWKCRQAMPSIHSLLIGVFYNGTQ